MYLFLLCLRNGVMFWVVTHTLLYASSAWKNVEERTQLHVIEGVGVACRKLEHPDSACTAEI